MMKYNGKLRAFGGEITRIVHNAMESTLLTSCIDGFVRLHDAVSKQQKWRVYCKVPVTGCCVVHPAAIIAQKATDTAPNKAKQSTKAAPVWR